ncbi:MAG: hypothetical protein ACE5R5_05100 [Nitrosarchaeum sp.]
MIIGKINNNEKRIKFNLDIVCTNCGKSVPGGMQASENYYGTDSFKLELDNFLKNYLCGICRDKKKIANI